MVLQSPEVRCRFEARLRRQLLAPLRFSLVIGAVLFLVFGLWEGTQDPSLLSWSVPVRSLIAGSLLSLYGASFTAVRRRTDTLFLLGTIVAGTGVTLLGARVPDGRLFMLASLLLLVPFVAVLASSMEAALAGGSLVLIAANVGAVVLHAAPQDFLKLHLFLLPAIGAAAVLASLTRRSRLHAFQLELALEHQARHDSLSGALTRAAFLALADAARAGMQQASVLVLDVDFFKTLNDRFGHSMGDEAIRRLADAVRRELREGDVFGRMGGEEFAVLLPGDGEREARLVAERLRLAVSTLTLESHGQQASMTVSVGVAEARPGEDLETLVHRADAALYASKRGGRNRVSVATSENPRLVSSAPQSTSRANEEPSGLGAFRGESAATCAVRHGFPRGE